MGGSSGKGWTQASPGQSQGERSGATRAAEARPRGANLGEHPKGLGRGGGSGGHPGVSLAVRGRVVHWGRAARAAVRQGEAQRNSRRRRPWGGREAGGPLGRHQAWV